MRRTIIFVVLLFGAGFAVAVPSVFARPFVDEPVPHIVAATTVATTASVPTTTTASVPTTTTASVPTTLDTATDTTTDDTTTTADYNPPPPDDCDTEGWQVTTDADLILAHGYGYPSAGDYFIVCDDGSVIAIRNGYAANCCL